MTVLIVLSAATITAGKVECCQRHCENWCQARDRDLRRTTL